MSNSYTYIDKVASLVQEAAYAQTNLSNQEGDAASIPVSHIDGENLVIKSLSPSQDDEEDLFSIHST